MFTLTEVCFCAGHDEAAEHGSQPAQLHDEAEDESAAGTRADLSNAQQAQREALQTEQESLQSSQQGLKEVREAMQQQQQQGMRCACWLKESALQCRVASVSFGCMPSTVFSRLMHYAPLVGQLSSTVCVGTIEIHRTGWLWTAETLQAPVCMSTSSSHHGR